MELNDLGFYKKPVREGKIATEYLLDHVKRMHV